MGTCYSDGAHRCGMLLRSASRKQRHNRAFTQSASSKAPSELHPVTASPLITDSLGNDAAAVSTDQVHHAAHMHTCVLKPISQWTGLAQFIKSPYDHHIELKTLYIDCRPQMLIGIQARQVMQAP